MLLESESGSGLTGAAKLSFVTPTGRLLKLPNVGVN